MSEDRTGKPGSRPAACPLGVCGATPAALHRVVGLVSWASVRGEHPPVPAGGWSHGTTTEVSGGDPPAGGADGPRVAPRAACGHGWRQRRRPAAGAEQGDLHNWVRQVDIDSGQRPGTTTDDRQRIADLERENRELRRANAILESASVDIPSAAAATEAGRRVLGAFEPRTFRSEEG